MDITGKRAKGESRTPTRWRVIFEGNPSASLVAGPSANQLAP